MKEKNEKKQTEKRKIKGHSVEIRRSDDKEELWIDGVRRKFFVTKDGYNLHEAAYDPPYKTLLEAVEHFLKNHPNADPHH